MRNFLWIFIFTIGWSWAQEIPSDLKIDSSFAFIQGYSSSSLLRLKKHFDQADTDKFVIIHYGGSHIQAENPTSVIRNKLQERFGSGGRGLMFNYGAANTYSSINYSSTFAGKWSYNKSFQGKKQGLPLGVCGMVVESNDSSAHLQFGLKKAIESGEKLITVFFENDSISAGLALFVNDKPLDPLNENSYGNTYSFLDSIISIRVVPVFHNKNQRFRFYGLNIENIKNSGVVYHSTGVGAAAYRSMLILEKLPEQAEVLKPDLVILDFGTNDILYHNRIESSLIKEVEKAIFKWKQINPEILIVLTSTQDLFYKNKSIDACLSFRNLMDSLARSNDCLFWNWYDLSGGFNTIRKWNALGYAKSDNIHLTKMGYQIKGSLLYDSFINTFNLVSINSEIGELTIPLKNYEISAPKEISAPPKTNRIYTVKSGDTLSEIAAKYGISVTKLKRFNHLSSDMIRVGQRIKIP